MDELSAELARYRLADELAKVGDEEKQLVALALAVTKLPADAQDQVVRSLRASVVTRGLEG